MSMFKKGPEIKFSDIKVPAVLTDLYYDLRERHLLPIALILVVAIVAVPIVLSQGGSEGSEGSETAAGSAFASPSSAGGHSGVLVAQSAPGLRDYHQRLKRLRAKNPFKQQYSEGESSASGSSSTSEGKSGVPTSPSETTEPSTTTVPEESGEPGPGKLTYYSYAIDVRVAAGGSQNGAAQEDTGKATVRRNLPELTMLPSRDTPAAVYMGSTKDGKKALMLISSNVDAIFGDGKCVLGSDSCQLLAMEVGVPETFVYGGAGRTYKIELLKIHLVATDKLNRAPLGKPKQSKSKKSN
jgi:hypothetical protein